MVRIQVGVVNEHGRGRWTYADIPAEQWEQLAGVDLVQRYFVPAAHQLCANRVKEAE